MIVVKALSRRAANSTRQLVSYLLRYSLRDSKEEKEKYLGLQEHAKVVFRHNMRARSLQGYVKAFRENEKYRLVHRKDSVALYHYIVAMDRELQGEVSEKVMQELSKEFVRLHGKNTMCISVAHFEKHPHYHLIMSGTEISGRSSRISKQKLQSLKVGLDRYLELHHPNLHRGISLAEKKKLTPDQVIDRAKASRQSTKAALSERLQQLYARAASKEEFIWNLQQEQIEVYERAGKLGVVVDGKKFRLVRLAYSDEILNELDHRSIGPTVQELDAARNSNNIKQIKERLESLREQEVPAVSNELPSKDIDDLDNIRANNRQDREMEYVERTLFDDLEEHPGRVQTSNSDTVLCLPMPKLMLNPLNLEQD